MPTEQATGEMREDLMKLLRAGHTVESIRCVSGSGERESLLTKFTMTDYRVAQQFTNEGKPLDWAEGTYETSHIVEVATGTILDGNSPSGFYIDGLVEFEA